VFEYSEFLVEVPGKEGEERDEWQDYVGNQRIGAGGEGGGKSTKILVQ
jgi:hypothetical protein